MRRPDRRFPRLLQRPVFPAVMLLLGILSSSALASPRSEHLASDDAGPPASSPEQAAPSDDDIAAGATASDIVDLSLVYFVAALPLLSVAVAAAAVVPVSAVAGPLALAALGAAYFAAVPIIAVAQAISVRAVAERVGGLSVNPVILFGLAAASLVGVTGAAVLGAAALVGAGITLTFLGLVALPALLPGAVAVVAVAAVLGLLLGLVQPLTLVLSVWLLGDHQRRGGPEYRFLGDPLAKLGATGSSMPF